MKLVLGLLAIVAFAPNADATCAQVDTVDQLIHAGGTIATDGAVLIGQGPVVALANGKHRQGLAEKWTLLDETGKPATGVKLAEIAPGVRGFVRTTPAKPQSKLVITDDAGVLGTFTYDDVKTTLPAPIGSNAKVTWTKPNPGLYDGPQATFTIDVASVPDDAAYLVIAGKYGSTTAVGAPHTPAGKATLIPYQSGGHCGTSSPGQPPGDGELITLVWMDRYGRKGTPSKPIKATRR